MYLRRIGMERRDTVTGVSSEAGHPNVRMLKFEGKYARNTKFNVKSSADKYYEF